MFYIVFISYKLSLVALELHDTSNCDSSNLDKEICFFEHLRASTFLSKLKIIFKILMTLIKKYFDYNKKYLLINALN